MREHAGDVQIRQRKRFQHLVHVRAARCVKARAAHAGLQLHVRLQTQAGSLQIPVQLLRVSERPDRLRRVQIRHVHRDVRGLRAKDQDLHADAGGAQLLRLVVAVDGHPVAPRLLQPLRHAHRAVAIAVGLADAEHLAALRQTAANFMIVMFQIVETDLHPGSDRPIHIESLFRSVARL